MADLQEQEQWEVGVYQLEATDPVEGGADGVDNIQAKQLANRTAYLKKQLEENTVQATESVMGMMKVATQAQTDTGTDDTVAVTPKKLINGFLSVLMGDGYIKFPDWLGGFIIQWKVHSVSTDNVTNTMILPIAFPSEFFHLVSNTGNGSTSGLYRINAYKSGLNNVVIRADSTLGINDGCAVFILAIGK